MADKYNHTKVEKKSPAFVKTSAVKQGKYNHQDVEHKWQKVWDEEKLYVTDIKEGKDLFFNLWMFPYPSAEGLHAGHAFASTGSDVIGRFKRMNGLEVFQPIGYDSFGIHSENYAIKINENPNEVVKRTTKHYEAQMRSLGHGYDWTRTVTTSSSDYYRWTQWLFVEMFKAGLAYKKKASVNFCPSCKTVLADEQVMTPKQAGKTPKDKSGKDISDESSWEELKVCERCGTVVEKRDLDQWFWRITDYADKLLEGLGRIDWSDRVIKAQRDWIGKSEGRIIEFKKEDGSVIKVFTTRPDTLNAATFIVLADEELYNKGIKDKVGEFTGEYAINPLNGKKLPIWKTNYVAPGYGTGAVMGVPNQDERDRQFAIKYHLEIVEKDPEENNIGQKHTNYHLRDWLVSRQRYWGAPIPMIHCKNCEEKGEGYLSSIVGDAKRGAPKPGLPSVGGFGADERQDPQRILHSDHSDWDYFGWWPVEDLPVLLPSISDYKPEGTGKGPLANHKEFYQVKCPHCGLDAERETDVMDTFVDSSWYYLRYPSVGYDKTPFDADITKKWLPVNLYFGGAEHSVLHLMYARFVTKVLNDLGFLAFDEPFPKFFAHGLMIKDGAKMSKSRGNVVNPDAYVAKFGADTLRLYTMFLGPMDGYPDFRDTGIEGMERFINRIWKLYTEYRDFVLEDEKDSAEVLSKLHQTIKKVTDEVSNFKYNTAISGIMGLVNLLYEKIQFSVVSSQLSDNSESVNQLTSKQQTVNSKIRCAEWDEALKDLCQMLAPFTPHLAEEIWVEILGQPFSIHKSSWPKYDTNLIKAEQNVIIVQINGKVRGQIEVESGIENNESGITKLVQNDEKISKWLEGKMIKKTIFIPGKIINFVI